MCLLDLKTNIFPIVNINEFYIVDSCQKVLKQLDYKVAEVEQTWGMWVPRLSDWLLILA